MKLMVRAISLPDDHRRSKFIYPLSQEIDFAFFDAFSKLPEGDIYDDDKACIHKGRPLSQQELGCYASHLALWRYFLDSNFDYLVVLEDDVVIDWGVIDYISANDAILALGGILRLFSRFPAVHRIIGSTETRFVTRVVGYASGTQAYLIGKISAAALIKYCCTPTRPIDDQLDREWEHGVVTYALFPYPAYEAIGPSRITGSTIDHRLSWMQAVRRFLYCVGDAAAFNRYRLVEHFRDLPRRRRLSA